MSRLELFAMLEKLAELHQKGILTDEEFAEEKKKILGQSASSSPAEEKPAEESKPAEETAVTEEVKPAEEPAPVEEAKPAEEPAPVAPPEPLPPPPVVAAPPAPEPPKEEEKEEPALPPPPVVAAPPEPLPPPPAFEPPPPPPAPVIEEKPEPEPEPVVELTPPAPEPPKEEKKEEPAPLDFSIPAPPPMTLDLEPTPAAPPAPPTPSLPPEASATIMDPLPPPKEIIEAVAEAAAPPSPFQVESSFDVDEPVSLATPSTGDRSSFARLVLVKGEGFDGINFQLKADEHILGRLYGSLIFPDDHYLSDKHANLYYDGDKFLVKDEGSNNGIFLKLKQPIELKDGDCFLAGEQLLRFEVVNGYEPVEGLTSNDDTQFYGCPKEENIYFRIVHLFRNNQVGAIHYSTSTSVEIGREQCDLSFPFDRHISGRHARIYQDGSRFYLQDLASKNGTFYRLTAPQELVHGDYFFVGQQLLRVELVSS